jgi:hypothetical protein
MNEKILQWFDSLVIFGFYSFFAVSAIFIIWLLYTIYRGRLLKPMAQREKEHGEFQESLGEDFDNE